MSALFAVLIFMAISLPVDASPMVTPAPEVDVATQLQEGSTSLDCPSCSLSQMRRNSSSLGGQSEMVEAVKRHILNMLHLSARPNLTQPVPRAALLNAIKKLHVGRVTEDGSVVIQEESQGPRTVPPPEPPSEIITFAEPGESTCQSEGFSSSSPAQRKKKKLKSYSYMGEFLAQHCSYIWRISSHEVIGLKFYWGLLQISCTRDVYLSASLSVCLSAISSFTKILRGQSVFIDVHRKNLSAATQTESTDSTVWVWLKYTFLFFTIALKSSSTKAPDQTWALWVSHWMLILNVSNLQQLQFFVLSRETFKHFCYCWRI